VTREDPRAQPRTVLLVSYAYPPHGSPGALRAVKFARYLPASGWRTVVVAPREGYAAISGLQDEAEGAGARVVRTGDVGWLLRRLSPASGPGAETGGAARPASRRAALIKAMQHLAVPDRNMGWYPFAVSAAADAVRAERPSVIVSSSPAVTNHVVAMRTAARFGLPWVADFRDPWTLSTGYGAPGWRRSVDARIERGIMRRAARIVVTTEHDVELFARAYPWARAKLRLVRNGYDPADFAGLGAPPAAGGPFVLTHAGSFYGGGRDPDALFAAMAALRAQGVLTPQNFRLRLVGNPEAAVRARVAAHGVGDLVEETGAVPYRQALAQLAASSAVLLLTHVDWSSIPVKFYDYLGVRRPILALTNPAFELAELVRRCGAGTVIHVQDVDGIQAWLAECLATGAPPPAIGDGARELTRQAAAREMAAVLDEAAALGAAAAPRAAAA
jgi:glycosyltransferase involved in cell wall biosynthesis